MRFQATFAALLSTLVAVASAAPLSTTEIETKAAQGLRLLALSDTEEPVWKTEDEKLELMRQFVKFVRPVLHFLSKLSDICPLDGCHRVMGEEASCEAENLFEEG